jgi:hypothetical protein
MTSESTIPSFLARMSRRAWLQAAGHSTAVALGVPFVAPFPSHSAADILSSFIDRPALSPPNYGWAMYRDRLIVDATVAANIDRFLRERAIPKGSAILFAARSIELHTDLMAENRDLVFIADVFDGSNGKIVSKVSTVASEGERGAPGRTVTIAAKLIRGLRVETVGGVGGKGLPGDPGSKGARGQSPEHIDGRRGEKGGKGKTGASGGDGGQIRVYFVVDGVPGGIGGPATNLSSVGGDGGPGGSGGPGGEGGDPSIWCKPPAREICKVGAPGEKGTQGDSGDPGPRGNKGSITIAPLTVDDYWTLIQPLSADWASYRMLVGEYYYRAFNTSSSETENFMGLAQTEFDSVLRLTPLPAGRLTSAAWRQRRAKAQSYITQLLAALTFFSQPRDLDVFPDFPRYEEVFTKYTPLVSSVFDAAAGFLDMSVAVEQKKQDLQREASNLDNLVQVLTKEKDAALADSETVAKTELSLATQRLDNLLAQIEAKERELKQAEVNVGGAIIGTVFAVVSLVAAIPSAGASLISAAASIALIVKTLSSNELLDLAKAVFKAGIKGEQSDAVEKLKAGAFGLRDYVNATQGSVNVILNFEKVLKESWSAKMDNPGYQKLLEDAAQAGHAKLLAELRKGQKDLAADAAGQRVRQAEDSAVAARRQLESFAGDQRILESAAFLLLKSALRYSDILQQYRFSALRAIEIYTLQDLSKKIQFDYGYVHPDHDKDYEEGFAPLLSLITRYKLSWARLSDFLDFRVAYDQYFSGSDWVVDYERITFQDAETIANFRERPALSFTVRANQIPESRLESHVEDVYVAFIGARSSSGAISTVIQHSGRYFQRTRDGGEINVVLRPRSAVALGVTKPIEEAGLATMGTGSDAAFWGRGAAADWLLRIEESEMSHSGIDLTELTKIQVWIRYRAIIKNPVYMSERGTIKNGAVLRDENTSDVYACYGNGCVRIPATDTRWPAGIDVPSALVQSLPTIPQKRMFVRQKGTGDIYLIDHGVKLHVPDIKKIEDREASAPLLVPEALLSNIPDFGRLE